MTERLHFHFSLLCIGEGNGNPLQCSCLENPSDGGDWWAAVYGVAQSRTWLKRLSSNSSSLTPKTRDSFCQKYVILSWEKEARHGAVHGVTESQTWLSNWTELSWKKMRIMMASLCCFSLRKITLLWVNIQQVSSMDNTSRDLNLNKIQTKPNGHHSFLHLSHIYWVPVTCQTLRIGTGYSIPNNEHERQGPSPWKVHSWKECGSKKKTNIHPDFGSGWISMALLWISSETSPL